MTPARRYFYCNGFIFGTYICASQCFIKSVMTQYSADVVGALGTSGIFLVLYLYTNFNEQSSDFQQIATCTL